MHYLFLIFAIVLALLLFAHASSAQNFTTDGKVSGNHQNWGFVMVDRESLINEKKYIGKYIGYGGFRDEASCKVEAEKRRAKLPDSSKLKALCFSPFQRLNPRYLKPFKMAQ